jgi:hypothetical protein
MRDEREGALRWLLPFIFYHLSFIIFIRRSMKMKAMNDERVEMKGKKGERESGSRKYVLLLSLIIYLLSLAGCDNPNGSGNTGNNGAGSYAIALTTENDAALSVYTFPAAQPGYAAADHLLTVKVTNTGTAVSEALTVGIGGSGAASFEVSSAAIPGVEPGASTTFTINPKAGLGNDSYIATVMVGAAGGSADFDVTFTVSSTPVDPPYNGPKISIGTFIEFAQIGSTGYPLNGDYELTADISLSNWTPIGTAAHPFTGTLDGNSKTITVQSIVSSAVNSDEYIGVFGVIAGVSAGSAQVKNLTLNSSITKTVTSPNVYAGVLAGSVKNAVITGLTLSGALTITKTTNTGPLNSGGVAGFTESATIKNTGSSVTLTGAADSTSHTGGITGYGKGGFTLENCTSTGAVSLTTRGFNSSAGGIIGYIMANGAVSPTVTGCSASGNISLLPNANVNVHMFYCGGVAGYAGNGTSGDSGGAGAVVTKSSYTGGTVYCKTGYPYAGGVIGYNYTGSMVTESYATGTVKAEGANLPYAGGVAGYISAGATVENCYSWAAVQSTSTAKQALAGGVAGATAKPSLLSKCYATGAVTATINGTSTTGSGGSLGVPQAANAGGISGSVYYSTPKVEKSAALNSAVSGVDTGSGGVLLVYRIGGKSELDGGAPELSNNIANAAMIVTGGTAGDKGANNQDGADCAAQPDQAAFTGMGWDFAGVWKMGSSGYPEFK